MPELPREKRRWWRSSGRILASIEQSLSFLEQVGYKKAAVAFMASIALALVTWLRDHVPWWAAACIAVFLAACLLAVVHRIQIIRATSKFDPRNFQKFGVELLELSREIFRFLADRGREKADMRRARRGRKPKINPAAPGIPWEWQQERDFDEVTSRIFYERFGARSLGALVLLRKIGVEIPFHMSLNDASHPRGLPPFLAMMGDLLSRGCIKEAVDASRDRDLMWRLH